MKRAVIGAVLALSILSACVTNQNGQTSGSNQTTGMVLGAIGGALLGANVGSGKGQLLATIGGGLLGAWAGSEIGARLDETDRQALDQATEEALVSDEKTPTVTWSNPDSGVSATVTATEVTYAAPPPVKPAPPQAETQKIQTETTVPQEEPKQVAESRPCRNITRTVTLKDGSSMQENATFCKSPDGAWEAV